MLDVAVLCHVRLGCVVQFRGDQSVDRIARPKVGIGVPAKWATAACASFFMPRLAMEAVYLGWPSMGELNAYLKRRDCQATIGARCREDISPAFV
jgi:hypothetical protein